MHPIEVELISKIEKNAYISIECSRKLHALPLGKLSQEFYRDIRVKTYCIKEKERMLSFRFALEEYIISDRSSVNLENIEATLLQLPSPIDIFGTKGLQNKAAGTYLLPISSELIRQVYLLEDIPLSKLFQKHFPMPSVTLFEGGPIPEMIQKRDALIQETLKKIDINAIESFVVKMQRKLRMKKRYKEEINRIAQRDEHYLTSHHKTTEKFEPSDKDTQTPSKIHQWASELMQDANRPYKPKCDPVLSKRILSAAKNVAAFSRVKHITSEKAIQSIFDEALYGRRTLMDFYLGFEPASLHSCDTLNGDANVVCLGPQDIDPTAAGGIIIEFDLPKLIQNKPAAFYKQRDLEYRLDRIRQVYLGNETISFDHSGFVRCAIPTSTYLKIVDGRFGCGGLKKISQAPKSSFISYNLEQIHEVLTLNFFRFMDRMTDLQEMSDQAYIDNFYEKLSRLTDEELLAFLTELEKNMTDTAEFNFYGAHQIDFSTIINITARYKEYTLNLPKFINDLNHSNIDELRRARISIPQLFESYRFLNYLLLQIQDSEARYYLNDVRKQCKAPSWVKYTPLFVSEKFELSWTLASDLEENHEQEIPVAVEVEKETSTVSILEPSLQIPAEDYQEEIESVSEKEVPNTRLISQIKIEKIAAVPDNDLSPKLREPSNLSKEPLSEEVIEKPVQDELFNQALQGHQKQFATLIRQLEAFSSYCSSSDNNTVLLYQSFVQDLKIDFTEIGQNFFSDAHIRNEETLKSSFELFKSACESLSQKAEKQFKLNTGLWCDIKPILTGFVGVMLAIAATLLTLGIATYSVAKNEHLRRRYIDTFFKSEPSAVQNAKNKWSQCAVKQELFGDKDSVNNGLVSDIEKTLSTRLSQ